MARRRCLAALCAAAAVLSAVRPAGAARSLLQHEVDVEGVAPTAPSVPPSAAAVRPRQGASDARPRKRRRMVSDPGEAVVSDPGEAETVADEVVAAMDGIEGFDALAQDWGEETGSSAPPGAGGWLRKALLSGGRSVARKEVVCTAGEFQVEIWWRPRRVSVMERSYIGAKVVALQYYRTHDVKARAAVVRTMKGQWKARCQKAEPSLPLEYFYLGLASLASVARPIDNVCGVRRYGRSVDFQCQKVPGTVAVRVAASGATSRWLLLPSADGNCSCPALKQLLLGAWHTFARARGSNMVPLFDRMVRGPLLPPPLPRLLALVYRNNVSTLQAIGHFKLGAILAQLMGSATSLTATAFGAAAVATKVVRGLRLGARDLVAYLNFLAFWRSKDQNGTSNVRGARAALLQLARPRRGTSALETASPAAPSPHGDVFNLRAAPRLHRRRRSGEAGGFFGTVVGSSMHIIFTSDPIQGNGIAVYSHGRLAAMFLDVSKTVADGVSDDVQGGLASSLDVVSDLGQRILGAAVFAALASEDSCAFDTGAGYIGFECETWSAEVVVVRVTIQGSLMVWLRLPRPLSSELRVGERCSCRDTRAALRDGWERILAGVAGELRHVSPMTAALRSQRVGRIKDFFEAFARDGRRLPFDALRHVDEAQIEDAYTASKARELRRRVVEARSFDEQLLALAEMAEELADLSPEARMSMEVTRMVSTPTAAGAALVQTRAKAS